MTIGDKLVCVKEIIYPDYSDVLRQRKFIYEANVTYTVTDITSYYFFINRGKEKKGNEPGLRYDEYSNYFIPLTKLRKLKINKINETNL